MQIQNKRGISPVIATILLVVIAIALFGAVYVWITSMQKDAIIKFDTGIEQSCLDINFNVIKQTTGNVDKIQIQNRGEITLYRVQLYVQKDGSLDSLGTIPLESSSGVIGQGESASGEFDLTGCEQIKAVPVLLGISKKTGTEKEYVCQEKTKFIGCS